MDSMWWAVQETERPKANVRREEINLIIYVMPAKTRDLTLTVVGLRVGPGVGLAVVGLAVVGCGVK